MHRAGIDRARRNRRCVVRLRFEILSRIGDELFLASGRAEIIRVARMGMAMLGGVRINRHAAHRVFDVFLTRPALRMLVRDVISNFVVRVSVVNCHGDPTLSLHTLWG